MPRKFYVFSPRESWSFTDPGRGGAVIAGIPRCSARTTPRVRAELQASRETSGALSKRYGLSRTTVVNWQARTDTADARTGPHAPAHIVFTPVEEAMIVEF